MPRLLCPPSRRPPTPEDWPAYRRDNARGACADEPLPDGLRALWTHTADHPPAPAWPPPARDDLFHAIRGLSPAMTFDRAFQPVIAGDALYYGSSADDSIHCLDAATGRPRWLFTTEGPVRLAPALAAGRLYAGSDDGRLYCLDAATGTCLWSCRPGPADRRLGGNERLISRWPVRCGPAVADGTVYLAAGLLPYEGVYLAALDALDGRQLWKRTIDVPAQGYLVLSAKHLFIPTGRTAPHAFRRRDGAHVHALPGAGGFGMLTADLYAHSTGEQKQRLVLAAADEGEKKRSWPGLRLVADAEWFYVLSHNSLAAYDREAFGSQEEPAARWQVACRGHYELIRAGGTLLVGGDNEVSAYRAADGRRTWRARVAGKAHGLALAGGRLFVSTDDGTIRCFAAGSRRVEPRDLPPSDPEHEHTAPAALGVRLAGPGAGYCLALGGDGSFAREIALHSQLQVIAGQRSAAGTAAVRKALALDRLPARQISAHHLPAARLPYPDRFFNLVIAEEVPDWSAAEAFRVLAPCGGHIVVAGRHVRELRAWAGKDIPGWTCAKAGPGRALGYARRGDLEGAGQWSHGYADPGNTACSGDAIVRAPMEVQWFGLPGPHRMIDRHNRAAPPVTAAGIVYVSGMDYLVALDACNGSVLWEKDLPGSMRLAMTKDCGNMVATAEGVYVAAARDCLLLDGRTGEVQKRFRSPRHNWGYLALVGEVLLGSETRPWARWRVLGRHSWKRTYGDHKPLVCSDGLFAFDRRTGRRLWRYAPRSGVLINPAIAADERFAYLIESGNPATKRVVSGRVPLGALLGEGAFLTAVNLRTGGRAWRRAVELPCRHNVFLSCSGGLLVACGSRNPGPKAMQYDLYAFDARTGESVWHAVCPAGGVRGSHGEQDQHPVIVGGRIYLKAGAFELDTGKPVEGWSWQGRGCGTLSASAGAIFERDSNPALRDLATYATTPLSSVTRPGCWINIIPAGGLVIVPESSSGCTCGYPLQMSLALAPR